MQDFIICSLIKKRHKDIKKVSNKFRKNSQFLTECSIDFQKNLC